MAGVGEGGEPQGGSRAGRRIEPCSPPPPAALASAAVPLLAGSRRWGPLRPPPPAPLRPLLRPAADSLSQPPLRLAVDLGRHERMEHGQGAGAACSPPPPSAHPAAHDRRKGAAGVGARPEEGPREEGRPSLQEKEGLEKEGRPALEEEGRAAAWRSLRRARPAGALWRKPPHASGEAQGGGAARGEDAALAHGRRHLLLLAVLTHRPPARGAGQHGGR